MLLVFLKKLFLKKKSWSSDVSGDLINRDLRGACACPAATAVQWSDGNRFGAGEVYRSGLLLSFFFESARECLSGKLRIFCRTF